MKRRLLAFFSGRNGPDALSKTITIASLILLLISGFFLGNPLGIAVYSLSLAGMIYGYFRVFSKNLIKRRKENYNFLEFCKIRKLKWKERKSFKYFRCPNCRAWVRVPKGRGAITITCRQCKNRFDKTT